MALRFVFLGPPGVGKGTYASRVGPILGIPHISTGDIFRAEVKSGSELGNKVKSIMEAGGLVSDDIVIEVLKKRLSQPDCGKGFILDGFPRTIPQAEVLDSIAKIDAAVNITVPEDILIEKMCSRRVCRNCGEIYNIAHIKRDGIEMPPIPPKVDGKCDKCGGDIYQRPDDNESVIKDRLSAYHKQTSPLIDYYKGKGMVVDFRPVAGPEVMVPKLLELLRKYG